MEWPWSNYPSIHASIHPSLDPRLAQRSQPPREQTTTHNSTLPLQIFPTNKCTYIHTRRRQTDKHALHKGTTPDLDLDSNAFKLACPINMCTYIHIHMHVDDRQTSTHARKRAPHRSASDLARSRSRWQCLPLRLPEGSWGRPQSPHVGGSSS
jgi:hypothetical protein